MLRKLFLIFITGFALLGVYGCIALMAATGQISKAQQVFDADYFSTVKAVRSALRSQNITLVKAVFEDDHARIKARYNQEKFVYINLLKISQTQTKVEIAIGRSDADKENQEILLRSIAETLAMPDSRQEDDGGAQNTSVLP